MTIDSIGIGNINNRLPHANVKRCAAKDVLPRTFSSFHKVGLWAVDCVDGLGAGGGGRKNASGQDGMEGGGLRDEMTGGSKQTV